MTPKFNDYLIVQLRRYMTIVVLGTTVFFMVLSVGVAQTYTRYNLNNDNKTIKRILRSDYLAIKSLISEIEKNDAVYPVSSETITSKMYQLRSQSIVKFNFTMLTNEFELIASNLYPVNRDKLLNSEEFKSALRQLDKLVKDSVVDNPIVGYTNNQQAIMTVVFRTEKNLYILEPLYDSFIDLEHKIKSNLIIVDRYDNVLFDTSLIFQDSLSKFSVNNHDYAVVKDSIGLFSFYTVEQKLLTSSIIVYTSLTAMMTLFVLIQLLKPLNRKLASTLDEPLNELLVAIEINKNGNLDYYIESHHFLEFDKIYSEFNDLLRSTKTLMIKNKELSEMKNKIEIKHLKSQFNPHFMYNALESIRYEIMFHPKNASKMLLSLGRLMHYSIEKTSEFVTVYEDFVHLEDYLILQKMRFKDRLNYKIEIEDQVYIQMIPKLIIQPLIENSIKHNMDAVDTLTILIKGKIKGGQIYFVVEDDGIGIEDNELMLIKKTLDGGEKLRESIGLYNINRTIKLVYGEDYGITLMNNSGLRVMLNLPVKGDIND